MEGLGRERERERDTRRVGGRVAHERERDERQSKSGERGRLWRVAWCCSGH